MKTGKPSTTLRLTIGLFLAFIFVVQISAQAYPIYYKCDKDKQLSEILTGQELYKMLAPLLGKTMLPLGNILFSSL